jgi:predicted phosphodiesterase
VQGWSHLFHFRTLSAADHFPLRICIFGDTGYHQGFALPYVQELASRDAIDLIIHLGDLAYDLHSDKGARGDAFLRQIEPIAAYVPFLTVAGNHEEDGANYTNYVNRFNMPNDPFGDSQVRPCWAMFCPC